jgi:hypothetical protein
MTETTITVPLELFSKILGSAEDLLAEWSWRKDEHAGNAYNALKVVCDQARDLARNHAIVVTPPPESKAEHDLNDIRELWPLLSCGNPEERDAAKKAITEILDDPPGYIIPM